MRALKITKFIQQNNCSGLYHCSGTLYIKILPIPVQAAFDAGEYALIVHAKFGFLLLLILIITLATFAIFRFRLNAIIGLCLVSFYALFLTYAFIQDTVCNEGKLC